MHTWELFPCSITFACPDMSWVDYWGKEPLSCGCMPSDCGTRGRRPSKSDGDASGVHRVPSPEAKQQLEGEWSVNGRANLCVYIYIHI